MHFVNIILSPWSTHALESKILFLAKFPFHMKRNLFLAKSPFHMKRNSKEKQESNKLELLSINEFINK